MKSGRTPIGLTLLALILGLLTLTASYTAESALRPDSLPQQVAK